MRKTPALLASVLWLVFLGGPVACSTVVSPEEVTKREMERDREDPGAYVGDTNEQAAEEDAYRSVIEAEDR